jgi:hypothetical protein
MMKYVFLVYRDEQRWETLSVSERKAFNETCQTSEQDLIRSFHLIDVKGLQNNSILTVRVVNGKTVLTDDSPSGSPEQLIRLLFIQARDLNAAIQIASQMPQARAGPIEVRPIVE